MRRAPVTVTIRQPDHDAVELAIGDGGGRCQVFQLSFSQLRLLLAQAADALSRWPIEVR